MTLFSVCGILVTHWIGDFLLQTNAMAQQKHKSLKWLTAHVVVYGIILSIFSLFLFDLQTAATFVLINVALHFITDFFTSKVAAKFADNLRVLYPVIGFDQLIHTITLIYLLDRYQG